MTKITTKELIEKGLQITVITLSDRASRGEYEDLSGPAIVDFVHNHFNSTSWNVNIDYKIIPDEASALKSQIENAVNNNSDIIFTTGGTGVGARDITPDIVKPMLHKEIPGVMEFIRTKYGQTLPNALLSRGVAGIIGMTQVYTLPGSVKAVKDYMTEILKVVEHLIFMLNEVDNHTK